MSDKFYYLTRNFCLLFHLVVFFMCIAEMQIKKFNIIGGLVLAMKGKEKFPKRHLMLISRKNPMNFIKLNFSIKTKHFNQVSFFCLCFPCFNSISFFV